MRIFIAGATGVIGRRIIPLLLAADHQVTAAGRTPAKRAGLARMGAAAVAVDLFAPDQVQRAVAGHDVIINLATAIPSSARLLLPGAWRANDRVRRTVSRNLADAAPKAGVTRLIQESFALIYQDQGDAWIDEAMPLQPAAHTRSILVAEAQAQAFTDQGGTGVVLRFGLFYGPDSAQTKEMVQLARRGWAAFPGPGDRYISSVAHDDAATAVIAALALPAGTYNVVDNEPLPRQAYFDALATTLNRPAPRLLPPFMRYLMGSVGETLARSLRLSNQKLRAASDWAPADASVRVGWQRCVAAMEKENN